VFPDDRDGQLDEAILAKSSVTFDEDVLLSVEKDIFETVDSENATEQPQRLIFSGNLTEIFSQDQNLVQNPMLTAEQRSSLITARAVQLSKAFDTCKATNTNRYIYSVSPPSVSDLKESFESLGLLNKTYQAPYYSKDADIPEMAKEYAGLTYRLKGGQGIATLTEWSNNDELGRNSASNLEFETAGIGGWEYASHPPSVLEVRRSVATIDASSTKSKSKLQSQVGYKSQTYMLFSNIHFLQIEGPTQSNIYGFKTTPVGQSDATRKRMEMSIMSLEVFGELL
jgi:DNA polymerase zeta